MLADGEIATLLEIAKQTPSLVVLVVMLLKFLGHLNTLDERRQESDKRRDGVLADVAAAYNRNSEALARTSSALTRFEDHLDDLSKGQR
jgi:hypothetical protein